MTIASTHHRFLAMLALLLVALAACGSPTKTASDAAGMFPLAESTAVATGGSADSVPSVPVPATAEAGTEGAAVGPDGIEVGFTAEGRPYRGKADAPVEMEIFSDYQCPFCARFVAETLPSLVENQVAGGEVKLVFYDYPLNSIHPQAAAAANAARCAGEQGAPAYWAMHDRLFAGLDEWSGLDPVEVFKSFGEELDLDMAAFVPCVDEERYAETVSADLDHGVSRGVSSTPSFFLNGQPLIGAQPLGVFSQAIAAVQSGETIAEAAPEAPPVPAVAPTPATIIYDDIAGSWGNPDAPVTIIEYTDYQCPYCARHVSETLPSLLSQMVDGGRVHYMVKDFPLDSIHPEARAAAVAARCAGEQDAYWPMHDSLFAGQGTWSGLGPAARDVFTGYAEELSLDGDAFSACLDSGKFDAIIQANQDEGFALGVNGTPAFFINGFPISGAQPYELFEYAVSLAEEGTLADAYVPREEPQAQQPPSGPVEVSTENAYSLGAADAPVTVVEFTDFQCPYCSRHNDQTLPQLIENYVNTGKVRYVFKDFPLTSIHPEAMLAAEAARCAGDQGVYVEMHHRLFSGQGEWSGQPNAADVFAGYAAELGLDATSFSECLESGIHEAAVTADIEEAIGLGVNGTPAFFLNGQFLSGAQPYGVFEQAIEQLLAEGESGEG